EDREDHRRAAVSILELRQDDPRAPDKEHAQQREQHRLEAALAEPPAPGRHACANRPREQEGERDGAGGHRDLAHDPGGVRVAGDGGDRAAERRVRIHPAYLFRSNTAAKKPSVSCTCGCNFRYSDVPGTFTPWRSRISAAFTTRKSGCAARNSLTMSS